MATTAASVPHVRPDMAGAARHPARPDNVRQWGREGERYLAGGGQQQQQQQQQLGPQQQQQSAFQHQNSGLQIGPQVSTFILMLFVQQFF